MSEWREEAACKGQPTEWFYEPALYHLARPFCDECPVRSACAREGIASGERGMWGGLSEKQRAQTPDRKRRYVCGECGVEMLQASGPPRRFCASCSEARHTEQKRRSNRFRKRDAYRVSAPEVRLGWEEKLVAEKRARRRILEDA